MLRWGRKLVLGCELVCCLHEMVLLRRSKLVLLCKLVLLPRCKLILLQRTKGCGCQCQLRLRDRRSRSRNTSCCCCGTQKWSNTKPISSSAWSWVEIHVPKCISKIETGSRSRCRCRCRSRSRSLEGADTTAEGIILRNSLERGVSKWIAANLLTAF